jgi:hypothetical protein
MRRFRTSLAETCGIGVACEFESIKSGPISAAIRKWNRRSLIPNQVIDETAIGGRVESSEVS